MPGVDMCDLPSPPPFSLYPPYPSSYFSSLHTRICILFLFFACFLFCYTSFHTFLLVFFHLIFLYSISICYFSSNAHLLSSALHFHLCYPPPFSCVFFFHVPSLPVILFSPSSSPSHLSSIPCSPFSLHLFFLSSCKYLSCLPLLYAFCS